jgi:hypothetical protein
MYFIGIDEHKFTRQQAVALGINIKINSPFQHKKDLNGTVPVLGHFIIAVFSFKDKQPERQIFIWQYKLMTKIHIRFSISLYVFQAGLVHYKNFITNTLNCHPYSIPRNYETPPHILTVKSHIHPYTILPPSTIIKYDKVRSARFVPCELFIHHS